MLRLLSGKKHHVISGFTYLSPTLEVNKNVVTEVFFNELSEETIEEYIKKRLPV